MTQNINIHHSSTKVIMKYEKTHTPPSFLLEICREEGDNPKANAIGISHEKGRQRP
jgi:hypothetical protein